MRVSHLLGLPLVGVLVLAATPRAEAYCLEGPLKFDNTSTIRHDIPVFLYAPGGSFLGLPTAAVEHELRMAIDDWFENSSADFRPYYAGLTSDTSSEGRVVVRVDNEGDECSTGACEQTNYDDDDRVGSTVWLKPHGNGTAWTLREFARTTTHELGHSFGLEDTYGENCDDGAYDDGGIMGSGVCEDAGVICLDDQLGMSFLYPSGGHVVLTRESTTATSWTNGSPADELPLVANAPLGSSTSDSERERLALARPTESIEVANICSDPGCVDVSLTYLPGSAVTRNMVSVANKSASAHIVAWVGGENIYDGRKTVNWAISNNGGTNYTIGSIKNPNNTPLITPTPGVTVTYDPRTDRYLLAFRAGDWRIVTTSVTAGTVLMPPQQGPVETHGMVSWRTPNIECRDQASGDNCLLVWLSEWALHHVHRARASLSPEGDLSTASIATSSIISLATPALTETSNSTYPWVLAVKQPTSIKAYRRSLTGDWTDENSATVWNTPSTGTLYAPTLSHVRGGGTDEIHLRYGRLVN